MKIPKVINRIYDDLTPIAATTVITPNIEEWIYRRYGRLSAYWNQDYDFFFAYPEHCRLTTSADNFTFRIYPSKCLLEISISLVNQCSNAPAINLTVEKTLCPDLIDAFNQHLQRLKDSGLFCIYRSNDCMDIATIILYRFKHKLSDYIIQKYFVHNGYLYIFSFGEIKTGQLDSVVSLSSEIKQIISSFSFINR